MHSSTTLSPTSPTLTRTMQVFTTIVVVGGRVHVFLARKNPFHCRYPVPHPPLPPSI